MDLFSMGGRRLILAVEWMRSLDEANRTCHVVPCRPLRFRGGEFLAAQQGAGTSDPAILSFCFVKPRRGELLPDGTGTLDAGIHQRFINRPKHPLKQQNESKKSD